MSLRLRTKLSRKPFFDFYEPFITIVTMALGGAVNRDFTDLTERFESMAYFSLKIISMVKNYTRVTQNIPALLLYNAYRIP